MPFIRIITGRSQTGKSFLVNKLIKPAKRLLIYDPKCNPPDYTGVHVVDDMATLARTLKKAGKGGGRYRLMDYNVRQFDLFCRAALVWGREYGPIVVVADELADVTSPGKAPASWGRLVRTGMGLRISVYAITQRPAESDKTCFGNATEFYSFHLARLNDRKAVAMEMDIDADMIDKLPAFHYVHKCPGQPAKVIKSKK